MFCTRCGKEVPEGAAFCASCGNPIGGGAPKAAPAAGASPTPHAAGTGYAVAKKKPPVVPIVVAVVVIVAVVAAIVTGGFGLLGGSGVSPKGSVEEYTWSELSAISDEIGKASDENAARLQKCALGWLPTARRFCPRIFKASWCRSTR